MPSDRIDLNLSPDKYTQNILGLEKLIFAIIKQSILKMNEDCIQQQPQKSSNNEQLNATTKLKSSQSKEDSSYQINQRINSNKKRPFQNDLNEFEIVEHSPIKIHKSSSTNTTNYTTPNKKMPRNDNNKFLSAHLKGFLIDLSPETDQEDSNQANSRVRQAKKQSARLRSNSRTPTKRRELPSFQEILQATASDSKKNKQKYKRKPKLDDYTDSKAKGEEETIIDQEVVDKSLVNEKLNDKSNEMNTNANQIEQQVNLNVIQVNNIVNNLQEEDNEQVQLHMNKEAEEVKISNLQVAVIDQIENVNENCLSSEINSENIQSPTKNGRIKIVSDEKMKGDEIVLANPQVVVELDFSDGEMSDDSLDELLRGKELELFELDEPKSHEYKSTCYQTDATLEEINANFKANFSIDQLNSGVSSRFEIKFSVNQDEKAEEELYRKLNKTDFERMRVLGQFNR